MRIPPLGAYFADDPGLAAEQAALAAAVTHTHPEGIAGAVSAAAGAAMAWRHGPEIRGGADLIDLALHRADVRCHAGVAELADERALAVGDPRQRPVEPGQRRVDGHDAGAGQHVVDRGQARGQRGGVRLDEGDDVFAGGQGEVPEVRAHRAAPQVCPVDGDRAVAGTPGDVGRRRVPVLRHLRQRVAAVEPHGAVRPEVVGDVGHGRASQGAPPAAALDEAEPAAELVARQPRVVAEVDGGFVAEHVAAF